MKNLTTDQIKRLKTQIATEKESRRLNNIAQEVRIGMQQELGISCAEFYEMVSTRHELDTVTE